MPQKTTAAERKNPKMGERLAQIRAERGYTQARIAKEFGISEVSWRKYEKGNEIASGRLVQICAVLECSPNWLLGYHDEGMHLAPDSLLLHQLKEAFNQLNDDGKQEAVKRVSELSKLPEYTEKKSTSAGAGA